MLGSGTFFFLGQVFLVIAGCWWCLTAFKKLPEDIESARHPKHSGERWGVIFYWSLTAFIILLVACFSYGIIASLSRIF